MKIKSYCIMISILFLIICYPIFSIHAFQNKQSDIYKNIVEYYDISDTNEYFSFNENYEAGKNSFERIVFKDSKKAFKQAMTDFKEACEFLETELQFGTVEYNWQEYVQQRAWNPQCEEKELQKEINLLFDFLNIYKNSFDQFY